MRSNNLLPGTSHTTSTQHRPSRASQFGLEGDGSGGEENENDALISTRKRSSTRTSAQKSFVPFTKDTENPYEHDTSEIESLHHGDSSQVHENTLLQMRSNNLLPGTSHTTSTRHRPHRASQFGLDYYHASTKMARGAEGDGSGEEKENDSLIGTLKRSSTKTSTHKSFVPFTKDTEDPFEHDTSEHDSLPPHHHNSPPPTIANPTTLIRYTIDEILSFSYSISGTGAISSLILLFYYGLFTGGPAVLVWGFLIAAFFSAIVVANIAEICSAYPRNAGSVYYWTGQLAPKVIPN